ncbi:MAG: ACT domain-containing protein [Planctomycetota bacterium]
MQTECEITVFLSNEAGALHKVCELLGANGVNIEGLTIQAATDHGVVRLIVSDPVRAQHLLESCGLLTLENSVLGVRLTNRAGALAELALRLARKGINIEYIYGSTGGKGRLANVYVRVSDLEAARRALQGIESADLSPGAPRRKRAKDVEP